MVSQQEYSIIIMVKNINNGDSKLSNNNLGLRLGSIFYPNDNNTFGIEAYYNKNNRIFEGNHNLDIYNGNDQTISSKNISSSRHLLICGILQLTMH